MISHPPETPPVVPGYEIVELIGRGAMGEVYLAIQQTLNRPVAIKFLNQGLTDRTLELEQRFRREAELMGRLSHPNVVTIFDFGTISGHAYLVMEYVKTGDLRSRMVPGSALPIADVRAILGQVIRAVAYLHEQGIIHRDIKPENILIDRDETPKVTDFGIAIMDSGFGSLTRTGLSLGTPGYIAPEQHYRLKVDERADQFSLAALAYELVTGRKPLGAFPRPSMLNRNLSRAAEAVILKGLSDDPTDRFAGVDEFGKALDRGFAASPDGLSTSRHGWRVAGSLLAASVLGVGLLAFFDPGRPSFPAGSSGNPQVERIDPTPKPATLVARSANLTLVLIPPGEFLMGSPATDTAAQPDERPQHHVRITRAFFLGVTEVTIGQFRAFVDAKHYRTTAEQKGGGWKYSLALKGLEQNPRWTWREPGGLHRPADDDPVVQVSWDDAVAFCRWLTQVEGRSFRLPTEAEWEYACRAGTTTRWSFGDTTDQLGQHAWSLWNSPDRFHKVGTLKPNAFGLHDMHGSVWEWSADWMDRYSEADEVDPQGPPKGRTRVLRGGSFDWDKVERTRAASRLGMAPNSCYYNHGFRVCSTAEE